MTEQKKPAPEAETPAANAAAAADTSASGTSGEESPQEESIEEIIARMDAEMGELRDRMLRALAETENVRRRSEKEKSDAQKFAASNFARDVLTIADNLARALSAVPEDKRSEDGISVLVDGIELTQRELANVLERHGVKKIDAEGESFDPNLHQAMFEIPDADTKPGTVLQVMQDGYVIHDRLLRPAMVGVAKAVEQPAAQDAPDKKSGGEDDTAS